jgi:serine/threonine protein kinase
LNGTPAFTAPEIYQQTWIASKKNHDIGFTPQVDIWSLGVISYYMLTGKLPFSGQADLLAYYSGETSLPLEYLAEQNTTPEASLFLENTLAANPADRLAARDLLDHAWLVPLLQESDPEEQLDSPTLPTSPSDESMIPQPLQIQSPNSRDIMLPGTIHLTAPNCPNAPNVSLTSPTSLRIDGDTYKQSVASTAPLLDRNHPAMHPEIDAVSSIPSQSQNSESRPSEQSPPRQNTRQSSQLSNMSPGDTLPPYTRRRSDAAPIPISDLAHETQQPGSPTSSVRNSMDRFEKFRRVSRDMVPRRSRRSRDHGGETEKEKEKEKDIPSPVR